MKRLLLLLALAPFAAGAQVQFQFTYLGNVYTYYGTQMNDPSAPDYYNYIAANPNTQIFVVTPPPFDGTYNCHAFAWANSQSVWVESQSGSTTTCPQIYYSGTHDYVPAESESDAEIAVYGPTAAPTHSAVRLTNSRNPQAQRFLALYPQYAGWWISKWDGGPLVIHKLNDCPFYLSNQAPALYRQSNDQYLNQIPASNYVVIPVAGQANVVCASGTQFELGYQTASGVVTIANPKSFTVTWGASSGITIANPNAYPVTATSTGSGTGSITATLTFPDGTSGAATPLNNLWIGLPSAITSISNSQWSAGSGGFQTMNVSQYGAYFYAWPFNGGDIVPPSATAVDTHGASSYWWTCSPSIFNQQQNTVGYRYAYGGFSSSGYATIYVHASNFCGTTTDYQPIYVSGSGDIAYSLSPNPASTEVGVSVHPTGGRDGVAADLKDAAYAVRIVDALGKTYYVGKRTGTTFTIPTSTLRPGTYWLIMESGGRRGSKSFMVVR